MLIPSPAPSTDPPFPAGRTGNLVVVGNGMVSHRLLSTLAELGATRRLRITVIGEETRPAYDRVALSSYFAGSTAEDLSLVPPGFYEEHQIRCVMGDPVTAIDREAQVVRTHSGDAWPYDHLVIATGSSAFVPPIPGHDGPGCFVYRTIEDLDAIAAAAAHPAVKVGAVIGGGLLGLEAANALRNLGLDTHIIEFAPRLMPLQLDPRGGEVLQGHVERLGIGVHVGTATRRIHSNGERPTFMEFEEADPLVVNLVVFSAGIRPRDELARKAGLKVGPRGGVLTDLRLTSSDPRISAIGECAAVEGITYGLVAPGYRMAAVAAARIARLTGGDTDPRHSTTGEIFEPPEPHTKLKLLGVAVASLGSLNAQPEPAQGGSARFPLLWEDPLNGVYQRLEVDETGRVTAAVLVGDDEPFGPILTAFRSGEPQLSPAELLHPKARVGGGGSLADPLVCSCENVSTSTVNTAIAEGANTLGELKACTKAGTGCGGCVPLLETILRTGLAARGAVVSAGLCSHFRQSRAELFEILQISGLRSYPEILATYGTPGSIEAAGAGCEICRPTVASILASLGSGHILDGDQAALQDTNDQFLANLQRDGTYSVVPRIPGGEITPQKLIVIGQIAEDYDLYTKITGGQRIDLFGARLEQLPEIWARLVDAGFESGHAYGKSLRTVKSCVGEAWCRYGVADSTAMAIRIEERYRGLRSPHKIKMAVSGCARECAEAQSKDVGVIATERGWNLWVGGNGGMRPRHAELLAEDLDDQTLIKFIDRFLMYYIRTADRLQRTASWIEGLAGGLDHLREVVIEDSLGVAEVLEEMMERHVASYECEWKATIGDPERVSRFVSFVNAPEEADPSIVFIRERGQIRPAQRGETPTEART